MHGPIVKSFTWPDEAATAAFAQRMAAALLAVQPGQFVVLLQGDLGAGKTTLVRHLLRALGVQGRIKSPTYAVVEPYPAASMPVWHFDFYRFNDPQEWEDAGFRDIFAAPGLKLAEWPDKAAGMLPLPDWELALRPLDDMARAVRLAARTSMGARVLGHLSAEWTGNTA